MRHMKKLSSLLLALVLALAVAVPAMAADPTTVVTVPENAKGTYKMYKIFEGTVDRTKKTMDITGWASNLDSNAFVAALQGLDGIGDLFADDLVAEKNEDGSVKTEGGKVVYDPGKVAGAINAAGTANPSNLSKMGECAYNAMPDKGAGTELLKGDNGLPDGYYVLVNQLTNPAGYVYGLYLLEGTAVDVNAKTEKPKVEKEVKEDNPKVGQPEWGAAAAYDVGDTVPFQLKTNLPNNYTSANVESYKLIFHDVQSEGLTFNPESVRVYAGTTDITDQLGPNYQVLVKGTNPMLDGDCSFEIVLPDLKSLTNLNGEGKPLQDGTEIRVEYTSTLNENAVVGGTGNDNSVKLTFEQNGKPEDTTTVTVKVYTFELELNKVDGDNNDQPLPGAEFKLEQWNGTEWVAYKEAVKNAEGTSFTFTGLDAGNYRLTETKVPAGKTQMADLYFEIVPTYSTNNPAELESVTAIQTTDQRGQWPEGTKKTAEFTTKVGTSGEQNGVSLTGFLTADIQNVSGVLLPSTGGIGTTIFYIVGGILAAGAVILLITKRRMRVEEE